MSVRSCDLGFADLGFRPETHTHLDTCRHMHDRQGDRQTGAPDRTGQDRTETDRRTDRHTTRQTERHVQACLHACMLQSCPSVCVSVCVCVRERERGRISLAKQKDKSRCASADSLPHAAACTHIMHLILLRMYVSSCQESAVPRVFFFIVPDPSLNAIPPPLHADLQSRFPPEPSIVNPKPQDPGPKPTETRLPRKIATRRRRARRESSSTSRRCAFQARSKSGALGVSRLT